MENSQPTTETQSHYYLLAEKLLKEHGKDTDEVRSMLVDKGVSYEEASKIVDSFAYQSAEKKSGNRDMLFGALWCIGGTILTVSDTGYIFWGAIVFGGIQFFKGVAANMND
ncbi:MAG: hypothetical protein M0D57_09370 [Sphingobacteriales bacterium JAD_PAG50586_3]|nr:MAG: hypothetical protein M0D57_09370 [Sphingobacteriales bacterium JAD_PAG50586_3]